MKKILTLSLIILSLFTWHNGDLNHDGKVTVTDLVIMRKMVEGNISKSIYADMNYDYAIDKLDLNILRHKLAYN